MAQLNKVLQCSGGREWNNVIHFPLTVSVPCHPFCRPRFQMRPEILLRAPDCHRRAKAPSEHLRRSLRCTARNMRYEGSDALSCRSLATLFSALHSTHCPLLTYRSAKWPFRQRRPVQKRERPHAAASSQVRRFVASSMSNGIMRPPQASGPPVAPTSQSAWGLWASLDRCRHLPSGANKRFRIRSEGKYSVTLRRGGLCRPVALMPPTLMADRNIHCTSSVRA